MRIARVLALRLCAALAVPGAACAEPVWQLEPAINFISNVNNAQAGADARSDQSLSLAASGGEVLALTGRDLLNFGLSVKETQYLRFHGLNELAAGPLLGYRHKFGVGAQAPWVAASAAWSYEDYANSIRDGNRLLLQLTAGQRWGDRLDGSAGLAYDRRDARGGPVEDSDLPGNAFDLHGAGAFARLGLALDSRTRAGVRLGLRRGQVVASTRPGAQVYAASDALTEDSVFGENYYAYRIRATTLSAAGTLSWSLSQHASLNLAGNYDHTRGGAFQYDGAGLGFSCIYRY